MLKITFAHKFYEFEYTARFKRGIWILKCYATSPNGYYCASKSWERESTQEEIEKLFY
jgi:hypothetical protein